VLKTVFIFATETKDAKSKLKKESPLNIKCLASIGVAKGGTRGLGPQSLDEKKF